MATGALVGATPFALLRSLRAQPARPGNPLRLPPTWSGETLAVAPANLAIWPGYTTAVQAINGSVPGPTIRVRRGEEFAARVANQLPEPLVLHWHGILAPERMDGHPRDQVPAGQSYDVRFGVSQPAATCWYHAHTDQLTAAQAYRGVAGLFIVEDPAEVVLGLPTGSHDLPLVFTDKRVSTSRQLVYAPSMMDVMTGYLGNTILVNGTPEAWLSADRGLYRFRLLNGSNARIYKVALSDGRAFHLIGTDGGLLPAPVSVSSLMLAPGQRLEILVDFSVPFGDLEIWEYRNTSMQFHPMHAHAAFCQVMSRSSAAQLPPEDAGWKDTVLVNPNETVRVLTRFDTHPGVFVHHCHNLEHEDAGMMQNFAANQFFHEDFRGAPSILV